MKELNRSKCRASGFVREVIRQGSVGCYPRAVQRYLVSRTNRDVAVVDALVVVEGLVDQALMADVSGILITVMARSLASAAADARSFVRRNLHFASFFAAEMAL